MTPFGVITLLCAFVGVVLRPTWLVPLIFVLAVFQGAAAINILPGTYGQLELSISPYYLLAVFCLLRLLPSLRRFLAGLRLVGEEARVEARLWLAFLLWSTATALLLPRLFAGYAVDAPRAGLDAGYISLTALQFGHSNLAQIVYLLLNLAVLATAFACLGGAGLTRLLKIAFEFSGVLVLAFGAYQKLGYYLHLPFPSAFLDSNPQNLTAGGFRMIVNGLGLRISSTFSEPSYAGGFFIVFFAYNAILALRRRGAKFNLALALASLLLLVFSGATTGYAAALIVVPALLLGEGVLPALRRGLRPQYVLAAIGIVFVIAVEISFIPAGAALATLDGELLHKWQTGSALHSFAADRVALGLFFKSWGLGVGLGSDRPRNFALYLLSNVGAVGTLLLVFLSVRLLRFGRRLLRTRLRRDESGALLAAVMWALGVQVLTMMIAIPDLAWPGFWVLLTFLSVAAAETAIRNRREAVAFAAMPPASMVARRAS